MESTNEKVTRQEVIQITMIIVTIVVICLMIFAIVTLIRNAEEIRQNPVDYAVKNSNIEYCTCYNEEGQYKDFGVNPLSEIIT